MGTCGSVRRRAEKFHRHMKFAIADHSSFEQTRSTLENNLLMWRCLLANFQLNSYYDSSTEMSLQQPWYEAKELIVLQSKHVLGTCAQYLQSLVFSSIRRRWSGNEDSCSVALLGLQSTEALGKSHQRVEEWQSSAQRLAVLAILRGRFKCLSSARIWGCLTIHTTRRPSAS